MCVQTQIHYNSNCDKYDIHIPSDISLEEN